MERVCVLLDQYATLTRSHHMYLELHPEHDEQVTTVLRQVSLPSYVYQRLGQQLTDNVLLLAVSRRMHAASFLHNNQPSIPTLLRGRHPSPPRDRNNATILPISEVIALHHRQKGPFLRRGKYLLRRLRSNQRHVDQPVDQGGGGAAEGVAAVDG
jgi:hypothetical protein